MPFDGPGGMAKSVEDLEDLMEVIVPGTNCRLHLIKSWEGIGIAYLDPEPWQFPESVCEIREDFLEQGVRSSNAGPRIHFDMNMIHLTFAQRRETREAFDKAESFGAKVTYNAPLSTLDRFQEELHCQAVSHLTE